MRLIVIFLILILIWPNAAPAQTSGNKTSCAAEDTACLFSLLETTAGGITDEHWRDSTYRELAKLLAQKKLVDKAVPLIGQIKTPDTKALTIRGIGMAAAGAGLTDDELKALFTRLHEEAAKIDHPPSHAIALTYIAMSQAFAGDDGGAMATAASMENNALRNKAYAESAEIQAERGDPEAAMASLQAIDDPAFREKALRTISKIFADRAQYESALESAEKIENPYQKAQAVLYILVRQISPEEVSLE